MPKLTWKAARINRSLTQKEVAKTLGISESMLIKYENYRIYPPVKVAVKMSELYGVNLSEMVLFLG